METVNTQTNQTTDQPLHHPTNLTDLQIISVLDPKHGVYLVYDARDNKVFVRKDMLVYNRSVYEQLLAKPVSGIPRIYDLQEESGILTVIEEYISGDTLEELSAQGKIFSVDEVLRIGIDICNILDGIHAFDPPIIHRDVKPSNVIMTPGGNIFLLDLNAARVMDLDKSEDTRLLGTKGFAAPEQYGFGCSDIRTDIYGLGSLLRSLSETSMSVSTPDPDISQSPSGKFKDARNTVSQTALSQYKLEKLKEIIQKCTQIKPSDRYPSAESVRNELVSLSNLTKVKKRLLPAIPPHIRKFFPPGFRTGSPLNMTAATLVYIFVFWAVSLGNEKADNCPPVVTLQIFILLIFFALVLFTCNYLNIQSRIPICNSPNRLVRLAGILLWDFVIFIVLDFAGGLCATLVSLYLY